MAITLIYYYLITLDSKKKPSYRSTHATKYLQKLQTRYNACEYSLSILEGAVKLFKRHFNSMSYQRLGPLSDQTWYHKNPVEQWTPSHILLQVLKKTSFVSYFPYEFFNVPPWIRCISKASQNVDYLHLPFWAQMRHILEHLFVTLDGKHQT